MSNNKTAIKSSKVIQIQSKTEHVIIVTLPVVFLAILLFVFVCPSVSIREEVRSWMRVIANILIPVSVAFLNNEFSRRAEDAKNKRSEEEKKLETKELIKILKKLRNNQNFNCAVAHRCGYQILAEDGDFKNFQAYIPVNLFKVN